MVSIQGGNFVPVPFKDMLDPETGRAKIRLVDISSTRYAIARRYMIRLRRDDFQDPHELAKFAAAVGISIDEFVKQFAYLVENEPAGLQFLEPAGERTAAEDLLSIPSLDEEG